MPRRDYYRWIRSIEWRRFANEQRTRSDYHCERCGKHSLKLDVHHLHYRTLGNETPEDVQVLCRLCHRLAHPEQEAFEEFLATLPGYVKKCRNSVF